MADNITKKMLNTLRRGRVEQAKWAAEQFVTESEEKDNFLSRQKILMQEAVKENKKKILREEETDNDHEKTFDITKDTPQFGDLRTSQEDAIRKAINTNVQFDDNALKYYPNADDMTLDGKIPSLNLKFQFRYNDPSIGCYVWADAMVLNDENARTIGKIRDAYNNWKDSINNEADLMAKLKKAAESED